MGEKVKSSAIYAEAFRLEGEVKRLQKALAAARRECEALRAALNTIRRGGGGMDPLGRMEMSRIARDALAVRAAGEEK